MAEELNPTTYNMQRSKCAVLGLSFDYHDSAAALVVDGCVIAAAQEERFSRVKNDATYPRNAIEFCLRHAQIMPCDLEAVVFYEKPARKLERIITHSLAHFPRSTEYLCNTMKTWALQRKYAVNDRIAEELAISNTKIYFLDHHLSHAASAFCCSPYDEATIVTVDGVGEYETSTVSHATEASIIKLASTSTPHSIGLLYSAVTAFLGFRVNEDEYKVMGMAGFGTPRYADFFKSLINLKSNGSFTLKQDYFNFTFPQTVPYTLKLIEEFGEPRTYDSPFVWQSSDPADAPIVAKNQHYANIAASIQRCVEDFMIELCSWSIKKTGVPAICLAGGVALNGLANGRIKKELDCRLYVQPAAGDAGGALGAALYHSQYRLGIPSIKPLINPYLGSTFDEESILLAAQEFALSPSIIFDSDDQLIDTVVNLLSKSMVIGWCHGRFEWGPRALGARSILANPQHPEMQRIVNEKIKFREPFRPFAPSVIEEEASRFFDFDSLDSSVDPEYFMLSVCRVREKYSKSLPAITHVDGTARVQLVSRVTNPLYYRLIKQFGQLHGIPILLNTSFNLRGEPIVNSPRDAFKTYSWCDMDGLVLGNYLFLKK